ncbi:phage tail tube protein [Microbaculum marinum]|uniref:Phage tail tube protein n=1 Tax=Microbaculum marinum TaxID=1764581 RepID=A0AAW9RCE3_9HYPH
MTNATGARHGLSYVAESVFGTTPGPSPAPSMLRFRYTGTTLNAAKDSFVSQEVREDRQIVDARHGAKRPAGNMAFELSYGAFDDWLEGALFGAWSTNVLKVGTTPKSFSVERRFTDINKYLVFAGVMVNTFSLQARPNGMITGSFDVLAADVAKGLASLGTPSDVATNAPFDAISGAISEGGSPSAIVTGVDLNLNNNLAPDFVIGSATAPTIDAGRSNLTGNVTARFPNFDLLDKFLDETESELSFALQDPAGNQLQFDIPRIKYTGGEIPHDTEQSLTLTLPWQGLRDESESTNFKITRTPA